MIMIRATVVLMLALLTGGAYAAETYGPYATRVVRVIDGDTLELAVDLWPGLSQRATLRLAGVNAPELHGTGIKPCELEAARRAKKFVEDWVFGRGVVGDELTLTVIGTDKYGRILGRLEAGKAILAADLLDAGHARPYQGGRRAAWC